MVRKGSLNTASAFQHCVLKHWFKSKEVNIAVLLIRYIKQHKYSHGGLITKIHFANQIDLIRAEQVEGKAILENNFLKLTFNEKWDEAKAQEQKQMKQEKSMARKTAGMIEKALVIKRVRIIRPRIKRKLTQIRWREKKLWK